MADLTKVRCVLAVQDLDASVDSYTRVLGMAIDFTAPGRRVRLAGEEE